MRFKYIHQSPTPKAWFDLPSPKWLAAILKSGPVQGICFKQISYGLSRSLVSPGAHQTSGGHYSGRLMMDCCLVSLPLLIGAGLKLTSTHITTPGPTC